VSDVDHLPRPLPPISPADLERASLARRAGYVLSTAIAVVAFAGSGRANQLRAEHVAGDMARLGYPAYVMTLLGVWKVLGAVAVALPGQARLKEWAYAGMIFDLTGAAVSRAASGDGGAAIVVPLGIGVAVLVSWVYRPPSRTFASTQGLSPYRAAAKEERA
jgi:uncharacterized membrane protein YphA (DoxX/SURF4 family)